MHVRAAQEIAQGLDEGLLHLGRVRRESRHGGETGHEGQKRVNLETKPGIKNQKAMMRLTLRIPFLLGNIGISVQRSSSSARIPSSSSVSRSAVASKSRSSSSRSPPGKQMSPGMLTVSVLLVRRKPGSFWSSSQTRGIKVPASFASGRAGARIGSDLAREMTSAR